MIELLFAVCLIDEPSHCKDVRLNFEGENTTAAQCMMNGQFALAQWAGDHPNWTIKTWTCGVAGSVAKI